jgi:hypothetical protein
MIFRLHPNSLFFDGTGTGLEPAGGKFLPSFGTGHPGGGAHLFSVWQNIFVSYLYHDHYFCSRRQHPPVAEA